MASGYGIGRGTGAASTIATDVADKNEELYNDALTQYNTDGFWVSGVQRLHWQKSEQIKQHQMLPILNWRILEQFQVQLLPNEQNEFEDTLGAQQTGYTALNTAKQAAANAGTANSWRFWYCV